MANSCDFTITVSGDSDAVIRFGGYIKESISESQFSDEHEVIIELDHGSFGDCEEDAPVQFLSIRNYQKGVRFRNGEISVEGWCKWEAPIYWLEKMSNLMPGIIFEIKATIEHELYQRWIVENGQATLVYEELIPIR